MLAVLGGRDTIVCRADATLMYNNYISTRLAKQPRTVYLVKNGYCFFTVNSEIRPTIVPAQAHLKQMAS